MPGKRDISLTAFSNNFEENSITQKYLFQSAFLSKLVLKYFDSKQTNFFCILRLEKYFDDSIYNFDANSNLLWHSSSHIAFSK